MSDRGNYQPIDPRRNPVINWGTGTATGYAAAGAVAWALRPVMPAVDLARRVDAAQSGVRGLYRGTRALGGYQAPPLAHVGADWWHGANDRRKAVAQIGEGFQAVATELMTQISQRAAAASQNPTPDALHALDADAKWIAADIEPTLVDWRAFEKREIDSLWTMVATDWTIFERWLGKLRTLRQLARARGFTLVSPEPVDLPKTVWEEGAEGSGGAAAWLGILKVTIAGAITLAGAYGLYTALRGGK